MEDDKYIRAWELLAAAIKRHLPQSAPPALDPPEPKPPYENVLKTSATSIHQASNILANHVRPAGLQVRTGHNCLEISGDEPGLRRLKELSLAIPSHVELAGDAGERIPVFVRIANRTHTGSRFGADTLRKAVAAIDALTVTRDGSYKTPITVGAGVDCVTVSVSTAGISRFNPALAAVRQTPHALVDGQSVPVLLHYSGAGLSHRPDTSQFTGTIAAQVLTDACGIVNQILDALRRNELASYGDQATVGTECVVAKIACSKTSASLPAYIQVGIHRVPVLVQYPQHGGRDPSPVLIEARKNLTGVPVGAKIEYAGNCLHVLLPRGLHKEGRKVPPFVEVNDQRIPVLVRKVDTTSSPAPLAKDVPEFCIP